MTRKAVEKALARNRRAFFLFIRRMQVGPTDVAFLKMGLAKLNFPVLHWLRPAEGQISIIFSKRHAWYPKHHRLIAN